MQRVYTTDSDTFASGNLLEENSIIVLDFCRLSAMMEAENERLRIERMAKKRKDRQGLCRYVVPKVMGKKVVKSETFVVKFSLKEAIRKAQEDEKKLLEIKKRR